ncbi:unnamed protein product [Prunus brigantina]
MVEAYLGEDAEAESSSGSESGSEEEEDTPPPEPSSVQDTEVPAQPDAEDAPPTPVAEGLTIGTTQSVGAGSADTDNLIGSFPGGAESAFVSVSELCLRSVFVDKIQVEGKLVFVLLRVVGCRSACGRMYLHRPIAFGSS